MSKARRVIIRAPGHYDQLDVVPVPIAAPGPGEVRVAVRAVGVNYADCIVRMGLYSSAKKYVGWPVTPGFDVAGTIDAVGDGVTDRAVGDRVIGVTRFGAYQSRVVLPRHQVFAMPEGWSMARAGAFPTVHLTAWYALRELSRLRPGYKVLVHSAAGGVGTAALAICRHLGVEAVGVVGGAHKVEAARAAGAVAVIDKSSEDLWAAARRHAPDGYHVILEASGVETLRQSFRALRPTGRLIIYGLATMLPKGGRRINWLKLAWAWLRMPTFSPFKMIDKNKTVSAFNLSYLFDEQERLEEAMTEVLEWARAGALPEPPIAEYPLEQVRQAHADLESGTTVGKLVLIP